ncbi:hypothetical protein WMF27_43815 [Sorangium sp. So ce281]|nr:hypothetical protein [Sorangium cellulosum]
MLRAARFLLAFTTLLCAASSLMACDLSSPVPPNASTTGALPSGTSPLSSSSVTPTASGGAATSVGVLAPPSAVAPIPAMTGGRPKVDAATPFDVDDWLTARGVRWRPDAACWSMLAVSPPQPVNDCSCSGTLVLPDAELLVCWRGREQKAALVPFVAHTVLYVAEGSALRPVLDVPSSAALDDCAPQNPAICRVAIVPRVEEGVLRFSDSAAAAAGSSCDDALNAVDAAHRSAAPESRAAWQSARDVYRRVCSGRGRYTWKGRALRRAP